jgi:hypothetical protein
MLINLVPWSIGELLFLSRTDLNVIFENSKLCRGGGAVKRARLKIPFQQAKVSLKNKKSGLLGVREFKSFFLLEKKKPWKKENRRKKKESLNKSLPLHLVLF